MFAFFFGVANIDEIQGVGLETGSMTPEPGVDFTSKCDLTSPGSELNWLG